MVTGVIALSSSTSIVSVAALVLAMVIGIVTAIVTRRVIVKSEQWQS